MAHPLAFYDPSQSGWVASHLYLSGNTRAKLRLVEGFKETHPDEYEKYRMWVNEEYLSNNLPLYILPQASPQIRAEVAERLGETACNLDPGQYIQARLSQTWIPLEIIQEFIAEKLLNTRKWNVHLFYNKTTGFVVDFEHYAYKALKTHPFKVEWKGDTKMEFEDLLKCALNQKAPSISVYQEVDEQKVKLQKESAELTEQALSYVSQIHVLFQEWVWTDVDRALRLTEEYNARFISEVSPQWDGSHLSFPGYCGLAPRPVQLEAVARIIDQPNTLLAHGVGVGKTLELILSAMKCKQIGLVQKPMLIVQNSTLGQVVATARQSFPKAKILAATEGADARERARFWKRIQSERWDLIIVPHSQFFALRVRRETAIAYKLELLEHIRIAAVGATKAAEKQLTSQYMTVIKEIEALRTEEEIDEIYELIRQGKSDEAKARMERLLAREKIEVQGNKLVVAKPKKKLSQKKEDAADRKIEGKLAKVLNSPRKEFAPNFEDLGVDGIWFDESHALKNLWRSTKMSDVAGLPNPNTQRTIDALLKVRHVQSVGGKVVFATGTPVSNTIAEWWAICQFLNKRKMEEMGIDYFDEFAATFLNIASELEVTATGGMKPKARVRNIINRPELMQSVLLPFVSFKTTDQAGIDKPKLKKITLTVPMNRDQHRICDWILERNDRIRDRKPTVFVRKEKGKNPDGSIEVKARLVIDNYLVLTGVGGKNSIDPRLASADAKCHRSSKLHETMRNTWHIWRATKPWKATQIVFLDLSTPKDDGLFNCYFYLKQGWMALGVPESEIAFIHDFDTNEKKARLFAAANRGDIRLMVFSTSKGGTGVNVQERCIAVHHVDIPWTPASVEQREGRVSRQGNLFREWVWSFTPVTLGRFMQPGFDSYKAQTNESKAKLFEGFMRGEIGDRECDDIGETTASFNMIKALASGDPAILEHSQVTDRINKVKAELNAKKQTLTRLILRNKKLPQLIADTSERLEWLQHEAKRIGDNDFTGKQFAITVQGLVYTNYTEACEVLKEVLDNTRARGSAKRIGKMGGLDIMLHTYGDRDHLIVSSQFGDSTFGIDVKQCSIDAIRNAVASIKRELPEAIDKLDGLRRESRSIDSDIAALQSSISPLELELEQLVAKEKELADYLSVNAVEDVPVDEDGNQIKIVEVQSAESEVVEAEQAAPHAPPPPEVISSIRTSGEPRITLPDGSEVRWIGEMVEQCRKYLGNGQPVRERRTKVGNLLELALAQ